MNRNLIIVTGYFGAPIEEVAKSIADAKAFAYLSLDREIEKRDGRTINRLCMMNGEHGYRNQEYEILEEISGDLSGFCTDNGLVSDGGGLVIGCGDGVLYDDMSREIALANELVIVGEDMTTDELWTNAKAVSGTYHAFMCFGTDEDKRKAFDDYIGRQQTLFANTRNFQEE